MGGETDRFSVNVCVHTGHETDCKLRSSCGIALSYVYSWLRVMLWLASCGQCATVFLFPEFSGM